MSMTSPSCSGSILCHLELDKEMIMNQPITPPKVCNDRLGKVIDEIRQGITEHFQMSTINLAAKVHGPTSSSKRP